jgi:hypothetical protein
VNEIREKYDRHHSLGFYFRWDRAGTSKEKRNYQRNVGLLTDEFGKDRK